MRGHFYFLVLLPIEQVESVGLYLVGKSASWMIDRISRSLMQISLQNRQRIRRVNQKNLLKWAHQILSLQKLDHAELGIILVNDRQIRVYNRKYRKKDRPTDVLSFPMREGIGGDLHPDFLGDVMISLERSEEEALLYGRSRREQLLILLIHGTLHLLGYDHERSPKEERRMQRRERLLFNRIYRKG